MSSIEPDSCACDVDAGEEVSCGLVIPGCDGPELLELSEEVLDEMARLVEVAVERAVLASVRLGWNDGGLAGSGQRCPDPLVSVERLVGLSWSASIDGRRWSAPTRS